MPRISSIKKKKESSKNFFENRVSVSEEDEPSVHEKSEALAKKIQQDKQNEIDEAVKKATAKVPSAKPDKKTKESVDKIIKKMVADAERKQPKYDKLRNNSVTEKKVQKPQLRNDSVTTSKEDLLSITDKEIIQVAQYMI